MTEIAGTAAHPSGRPELVVAILTRDRRDEVDRCLTSVVAQAAAHDVPVHVLINGSNDDTAAHLAASYPDVEVHSIGTNLGVGGGRNRLMTEIDATWVLHLDDDGTVGPRFIEHALAEIRQAPSDRVVIAGHIVDVDVDPDPVRVTGPAYRFSGGICIMRAAAFSRLGGYLPAGYRQGEEGDYAIRLHDADLTIWRSSDLVLFHPLVHDRAKRVEILRTGLTQSVVTGVRYAPWWALLPWVSWKIVSHLRVAVRLRAPSAFTSGLVSAVRLVPSTVRSRTPVRLQSMMAGSGRVNEKKHGGQKSSTTRSST